MRIQFAHAYQDIISFENLLGAWKEFLIGKRKKEDVGEFQHRLFDNISLLQGDLLKKTYRHGGYSHFVVSDPKRRDIHKASIRDRVLHRALYRRLYPFFDKTFISDSFSCRQNKGTHRAMNRFRIFAHEISHNDTRAVWVLKCDIRKFFANIDHHILFQILEKYIPDTDILWLLREIAGSFHSACGKNVQHSVLDKTRSGVGLPLGNLTSQLLVNIYMNEFDQFVKHGLKVKYYIRYADDFVLLHEDKAVLEKLLPKISAYLEERLKLSLHPDKVFIKTFASGVDFLGWVHFPKHRVLRRATKKRMFRRLAENPKKESIQSYLGLLSHGNAHSLQERVSKVAGKSALC